MKSVERWHSDRMGQDITLARWGHDGVPVLALPTAGGDAEEVERHKLVGVLGDLIEAGAVRVHVARVFPLDEAAAAHELSATGHVQGKVVIRVA